jgi:hypothetical protein
MYSRKTNEIRFVCGAACFININKEIGRAEFLTSYHIVADWVEDIFTSSVNLYETVEMHAFFHCDAKQNIEGEKFKVSLMYGNVDYYNTVVLSE